MKHLALITITIFATVATVLILWQFLSIVLLFVASLALAATIREPIEFLVRHRVPKNLALILVLLISAMIIVIFFAATGYVLAERLPMAIRDFSTEYAAKRQAWAAGTTMQHALAQRLPPVERLTDLFVGSDATNLMNMALGITTNIANGLAQLVLVIFLSIEWASAHLWFERLWLSLVPPERRAQARQLWYTIESGVGAYLRSELIQSLLSGFILTAGFWVMGVKYPILLAWMGALLWLIPLVGGVIALIPALLIGWLGGPILAILAALYMLIVFGIMEFVVEPRLDKRRRAGSILGLVVAIAMIDALGLVGLLVAPPLTVAIQILLDAWLRPAPPVVASTVVDAETKLKTLQTRFGEVQTALGQLEEPLPPHTANLYERFTELVTQVDQLHSS